MKFCTLFWLWLFGTIGSTRSSGQGPCLDRQIVWQQVNTQRVSEQTLSTWQRQWQACGLATDSVYGQVLFRLANLASQRAADDATLRWAGQALRVFQQLPQGRNPKLLFETRALLGKSYLFKNEYALARLHFEWILRQPFKAALRVPVRTSHYRLVSILREQGDYEAALRHADAGIDLAESGRDSLPLVNLHYEKALTLNRSGRYSEALQAGTQTARLAERFGIISAQIRSTELLAMIYSKLRQAPEAVGFYQKTIRLCQDNRQPIASSTFTNLGFAYYDLSGDYEKAIYYYQKALGAENDPYQRSRILNNLGAAFWQKHDFKTALQTYQQAFQALFPNFDPHNLTRNPAPEVMRRVARKEYLLTLTQDKADTWLAWAKATNNRTYLRHALATYRTADQMIDFMRWEHVGEGSKKFWREKTHQLYENAIEACHRLDQPEDAFYFFEKSRAALLADRLNELGASQLLTPADQKREADLQKTVNDLRQKVGDLKVGDKTADSLRQKLLVEEETQTAFVRSLETRNPAYFRYRYDTSAASLQTVRQNLLTEGQTLLEYFVGDSVVYALTVTTGAAKITRLNAPNYAQATRQLLTLSADAGALNQHFPDFLKTSHQLFQQLFAPLGVPKGRVIVSPDGVLLPLELLSRSPTDPDYLLRDYTFSYTYSAQFLLKQASRKPLVSGSFLGMAPVAFAGGQPTLGGSDASLNAVATGFFSPTLLLGSAATKRAFLRELPRHRVAQLYAHAQADSSGQEPEIFFADSSLRASELSGLGLLPTQLVVLSACQTGVGQTTRGEGVFSLARSLALAGVPSTVTTLWRVDNVATYRLTELFFEKIGDELPADEALQQAKLAYLVAAPGNRQLPPFWAGMVLIGSAAPVEQGTSLWIWAGGGVALLGLGVWGWRQKKAPPRWLS